jgi:hypothetical protein
MWYKEGREQYVSSFLRHNSPDGQGVDMKKLLLAIMAIALWNCEGSLIEVNGDVNAGNGNTVTVDSGAVNANGNTVDIDSGAINAGNGNTVKIDTIIKPDTIKVPAVAKTDSIVKTDTITKVPQVPKSDSIVKIDTVAKAPVIVKVDTVAKVDTVSKVDTITKVDTVAKVTPRELVFGVDYDIDIPSFGTWNKEVADGKNRGRDLIFLRTRPDTNLGYPRTLPPLPDGYVFCSEPSELSFQRAFDGANPEMQLQIKEIRLAVFLYKGDWYFIALKQSTQTFVKIKWTK